MALILELDTLVCCDISDACYDLCHVARVLGIETSVVFNGIRITANPSTKWESLRRQYMKQVEER